MNESLNHDGHGGLTEQLHHSKNQVRPNGSSNYPVSVVQSPQLIPFSGLLTNRILSTLPGVDLSRLLPHLESVNMPTGQEIYSIGQTLDFSYFPETVVVSHIYFLEDGSSTGVTLVGNEGVVGLSAIFQSRPRSYWTHVIVGGNALRIRSAVLKQEFARGERLQDLLLSYTSERLAQLSQKAVCGCRHSLAERLCTWLLMVFDRTREKDLPLTHETMANLLGTRRASVTASCHALRDSGVIKYSRGLTSIVDRKMLESAACECYRTLSL